MTCEKDEVILHTHSDECYDNDHNLICGKMQVEAHQHDDACLAEQDADNGTALMSLNGVPETILQKLAEQGIYPGTANAEGSWTVYDAATESNASIKATVTLPSGAAVGEGYYLYIREVESGEGYYPDTDALKAAVGDAGAYSDVQCYAIHWVHIYEEGGEWKYDLDTDSVLGGTGSADDTAPKATVQIEYLNGADLHGSSAHRKLMVFNSRNKEGT